MARDEARGLGRLLFFCKTVHCAGQGERGGGRWQVAGGSGADTCAVLVSSLRRLEGRRHRHRHRAAETQQAPQPSVPTPSVPVPAVYSLSGSSLHHTYTYTHP